MEVQKRMASTGNFWSIMTGRDTFNLKFLNGLYAEIKSISLDD
jgi:hypothetical protein